MRESVPCPACSLVERQAHDALFVHQPGCHQFRVDALVERERRAQAEAWQLEKRRNRLQKQIHRAVRRISEGRSGVLTAKCALESVRQAVQRSSLTGPTLIPKGEGGHA
jgi:hypothetical protein